MTARWLRNFKRPVSSNTVGCAPRRAELHDRAGPMVGQVVEICKETGDGETGALYVQQADHSERSEAQLRDGDRAWSAPSRLGVLRTVNYLPATASTAFGLVLAMARSVRAAPLGCLRPCSQPCNVRTDTPMSAANCD